MSATEEDTELRDLLIQNLENNGVLNKLKAEMRAAVFLAMEEQDKAENKIPIVNENLKKHLNTKDGRLVAGLIVDFLQVFNLDFTLAVFQPEINSLSGVDSRDQVCRDLGLCESEVNRKSPLLLELVRRDRNKETSSVYTEELSPKHVMNAKRKFEVYDKDRSGFVRKEDVKCIFADLFPNFNKNMLDRFITDELRPADKPADFQQVLGLYQHLFAQCRHVVVQDAGDLSDPTSCFGHQKVSSKGTESNRAGKEDVQQGSRRRDEASSQHSCGGLKRALDVDLEVEEDLDDGDSFFDDPLPKPQKTYGCSSFGETETSKRTDSQKKKLEVGGVRENPAASHWESVQKGGGASITSEPGYSRKDEDVEYDDDFNSHRSDLSKSELSISEEIEEVSIEGPENSDKFDEITQDLSVSQLSQSHGADYMEDVA